MTLYAFTRPGAEEGSRPVYGWVRPPAPQPSQRPPRSRVRRLAVIAVGGMALIVGMLGAVTAYAALTLPPVTDIGRATGTVRIVDRSGRLIGEYGHDSRSRTSVHLDQVATVLVTATLATEDRDFFREGSVNPTRIARALLVDVVARRPDQGGSTITQQLAKLAFLSPDKSPMRKLREVLLADRIDGSFTKAEILEKYLNLVYYGDGATGIADAGQRFFGKKPADLDLREASLLAGLPQAPATNDPFSNPEAAWARQHIVLSAMVDTKAITPGEAAAVDPLVGGAHPTPAELDARTRNRAALSGDLAHGHRLDGGPAPHFVQYVMQELETLLGGDNPALSTGTLTVTTTLDLDAQHAAEKAVTASVSALGRGANNGALVQVDSHTGGILALVGSVDYGDASIAGAYDVVTAARRPGSTFKPFVYEEGFRTGRLTPQSILQDTAQESRALGGVQDFDRQFQGPVTVSQALIGSRNVPAEQAMARLGSTDVNDFAHQLGITSPLADNATTAIGTSAVRPVDLAGAYAAFANGGTRVTPTAIAKVVDESDGSVLVDHTSPAAGERLMTDAQAYQVTHILRGESPTYHLGFNRDVAGKSGTTDDFVDAWFVAYTPDWVTVTWAGHTGQAGEVGMQGVGGLDVGATITAPFVNSLSPSRGFVPVGVPNCPGGGPVPVGPEVCPAVIAPSGGRDHGNGNGGGGGGGD